MSSPLHVLLAPGTLRQGDPLSLWRMSGPSDFYVAQAAWPSGHASGGHEPCCTACPGVLSLLPLPVPPYCTLHPRAAAAAHIVLCTVCLGASLHCTVCPWAACRTVPSAAPCTRVSWLTLSSLLASIPAAPRHSGTPGCELFWHWRLCTALHRSAPWARVGSRSLESPVAAAPWAMEEAAAWGYRINPLWAMRGPCAASWTVVVLWLLFLDEIVKSFLVA